MEFFLIDYIIDCAYRNIPLIREMIDILNEEKINERGTANVVPGPGA